MTPKEILAAIKALPPREAIRLALLLAGRHGLHSVLGEISHGVVTAVCMKVYKELIVESTCQRFELVDIKEKRRKPKKGNEQKYLAIRTMEVNGRVPWEKVFKRFGIPLDPTVAQSAQERLKRGYRRWKNAT